MVQAKKKPEYVQIVTPRGVALWCRTNKPEAFENKGDKFYSVSLRLRKDDPETQEMLQELQRLFDKWRAEAVSEGKPDHRALPFFKDDPEDADSVILRFRHRETRRAKDGSEAPWRPAIFDAKGEPVPKVRMNESEVAWSRPEIGNGSVVRVSFFPRYWHQDSGLAQGQGLTLVLDGVQVLKLIEYKEGADRYGFKAEDEGDDAFVYDVDMTPF